jgi:hypothetical protein
MDGLVHTQKAGNAIQRAPLPLPHSVISWFSEAKPKVEAELQMPGECWEGHSGEGRL